MKEKICFLLSVVVYRLFLDWNYINIIHPTYEYSGFYYYPDIKCILYSWIVLLFFSWIISFEFKSNKKLIPYISICFFLLRFVPYTSMVANLKQSWDFVFCQTIYWLLLFVLLQSKWLPNIPKIKRSSIKINIATIVFVLVIVFISGYYAHFRLNFSFLNVYDLRSESFSFKMNKLLLYLWSATRNILPILMIYYFQRSKKLVAFLILFVIFLNFSIDGSKNVIFKGAFCVFCFYFIKTNMLKHFVSLFLLLLSSSIFEFIIFHSQTISNLIIRRVLFLPSLIDTAYYDYIKQNGPIYFSAPEGGQHIGYTIGELYFSEPEMMVNNGLFSDALLNLGYIGLFVYPIIICIYLKYCEKAFVGINNQTLFFVSIIIVSSFGSSQLTTSLLTHGVFLLCVLLYIMPRIDMINKDEFHENSICRSSK